MSIMSRLPGRLPESAAMNCCIAGFVAVLILAATRAQADLFHGLNAGAPVWDGSVILTPQKAHQFSATGSRSIRVNFRLDSGATSWNATQLALYDQVVANARGAGLDILGLFSNETVAGGQAAWNDDADNDGFNNYVSQFASAAGLLVNRYGNSIRRWELWNEPNAWTNANYAEDPRNAGGSYILPRVYARMLSETYRALESASLLGPQGASLMSGGLFAHDIGGSFSTAMDYMQQVYSQNDIWNAMQADFARRYPWDEFGYHVYISQGSPLQSSQLASYLNAVRYGQASNADPSNVAVTEFGWQTAGSNTPVLQRDNMATAYNYFEAQNYITDTYWYQWTDDTTGAWGLVDGAEQPKLSYQEFVARNASPPGDFDGNRVVNSADFLRWRQTFGSMILLGADGNRNNIVDAADYVIWRKFVAAATAANVTPKVPAGSGSGTPAIFSGTPVPEPAAMLMILTGILVLLFRQRAFVS
jgi:hypothetical protein